MTGDLRNDVVGPAAEDARDRDGHRLIWLGVAGAIICFLVLGGLFVWRTAELQSQADSLTSSVTEQHQAAQALSDQVRELGGTPSVQPPAVTGVAGPAGAVGPKGDKGDPGTPGANGTNGTSPPCLASSAECQGTNGTTGQSGADGQPGQPGKDGTNGMDGATGPAGPQGAPGPACPDGYTLGPAVILSPDGSTHQGLACIQDTQSTTSSSTGLLRIGR